MKTDQPTDLPQLPTREEWIKRTGAMWLETPKAAWLEKTGLSKAFALFKRPRNKSLRAVDAALKQYEVSQLEYHVAHTAFYKERTPEQKKQTTEPMQYDGREGDEFKLEQIEKHRQRAQEDLGTVFKALGSWRAGQPQAPGRGHDRNGAVTDLFSQLGSVRYGATLPRDRTATAPSVSGNHSTGDSLVPQQRRDQSAAVHDQQIRPQQRADSPTQREVPRLEQSRGLSRGR